jgi:hypothetical protein
VFDCIVHSNVEIQLHNVMSLIKKIYFLNAPLMNFHVPQNGVNFLTSSVAVLLEEDIEQPQN